MKTGWRAHLPGFLLRLHVAKIGPALWKIGFVKIVNMLFHDNLANFDFDGRTPSNFVKFGRIGPSSKTLEGTLLGSATGQSWPSPMICPWNTAKTPHLPLYAPIICIPGPRYPGNSGALVVIVWGICAYWCTCRQGTCTGWRPWPAIWQVLLWYGGQALLVTRRRRCHALPCPALRGSQWILAGDLLASKERVWPQSPLVSEYSGAGDVNDRCITDVLHIRGLERFRMLFGGRHLSISSLYIIISLTSFKVLCSVFISIQNMTYKIFCNLASKYRNFQVDM